MITSIDPTDWKDLQDQACLILSECGFNAETELTVNNARGTVELDILAKETVSGRTYTIICECKYWKSKIPKAIIHGFRTVVGDTGANLGIIITTSDYQSGSFDAAEFTNIQLLTWEQFQEEFEEQWIKNYFRPIIAENLDPLFTYSEPFLPLWFPQLSEEDKELYISLHNKYSSFGNFMLGLAPYGTKRNLTLPINNELIDHHKLNDLPQEILTAQSYREFLNSCLQYGEQAILKFRELRDKVDS